MADYYVNSDGSVTKKKKKNDINYRVGNDGKVQVIQEDIAPVKEKVEEEKKWYQTGALDVMLGADWPKKILQVPEVFKDNSDKAKSLLSDGFQLSDAFSMSKEIGKDTVSTIGGTVGDIGLGVAKGIANVGEGLGDAATYGIAQIHDWTGNDERANQLRQNASIDVINNAFAKPQGYVNKASVIGDSGDKVAEGIGYMASIWAAGTVGGAAGGALAKGSKATKALNAVQTADKIKKATTLGTTLGQSGLIFSNSTGSNMADIYQQYGTEGVGSGEAWGKALGSAAIETTTELMLGMFGKADAKIVNGLTKRANSALGKVLTRAGGQAVGEGIEEVVSYAGNWVWDRVVDAASKGEGATFAQEWSWEDMWEQAGIAALTALTMGGGSTSSSILENKTSENTWKDALNETARQQDVQAQIEELEDQKAKLEKKMGQQGLTQTQIDSTLTEMQQVEQQLNELQTQGQIAPTNTSIDTNAQQITNTQVDEEAYHLADPQVKQKYAETVDISKLDVVEQNGGGNRNIQYWVDKIQQDGGVITDPIEVAITDNGKYKIYDGHHRLQAAQELGLKEIPVAFIQEGHYTNVPSEFLTDTNEQKTYYHGTRGDFDTFDNSKIGQNYEGDWSSLGKGFYFSNDYNTAKEFGEASINDGEVTVKEATLDIKNPFFVDDLSKVDSNVLADIQAKYELGDIANGYNLIDGLKKKGLDSTEVLKQYGYDSVVAEDEVMVFDASQIKTKKQETPNTEQIKQTQEDTTAQIEKTIEETIAPIEKAVAKLTEQVQEKIEGITEQLNTVVSNIEEMQAPISQEVIEKQRQDSLDSLMNEVPPVQSGLTELEQQEKALFDEFIEERGFDALDEQSKERYRYFQEQNIEEIDTDETEVISPLEDRNIEEVGNRKVKAYQYENPEVRPYFQAEAENMLYDLDNTIKGERIAIKDQEGYITDWAGITRQTTEAIAYLKDNYGYSYAQIRKGLNDIIEDNGKENNAVAKRIEFMLDERLREGYTTSDGIPIPANEDYINFLKQRNITQYSEEAYNEWQKTLDGLEAPIETVPESQGLIPEPQTLRVDENMPIKGTTSKKQNIELTDTSIDKEAQEYEKHTGTKVEKQDGGEKLTKILTDMPEDVQESRLKEILETAGIKIIDKGITVKNDALKYKNQTLEEDYNQIKHANREAVNMAMDGYTEWDIDTNKKRRKGRLQSKKVTKSIEDALEPVKKMNETGEFYNMMYNKLNIDRMTIESRANAEIEKMLEENPLLKELNRRNTIANIEARLQEDTTQMTLDEMLNEEILNKNNDLFYSKQLRNEEAQKLYSQVRKILKLKKAKNKALLNIEAAESQENLKNYEGVTEFETAEKDIRAYVNKWQDILVDSGILSEEQKTNMNNLYPHYIPAYRNVGKQVINANSFNNNIKPNDAVGKAKGGTQDILPLDHSMLVKTKQVIQSARVNKYLQNLKKTYEKNGILNIISSDNVSVEESFEEGTSTERITKTESGQYTATVYENGKKTTFEISRGQYEALKPSDIPVITTLNTFVDMKRALLTEYNLFFGLRNFMRDMPTAFLQSQNSFKWLSNVPEAVMQVWKKGQYYQYAQSLGAGNNDYNDMNKIGYADIMPINTNADHKGNKFSRGWQAVKDWKGVKWISNFNSFIEQVPRMAEFITAVDSGKSGAGAIYAQDEVTVNFGKGGDWTKAADRNITSFVNANMQGGYKIANVFRDAYAYDGGAKGVAKVLTKWAIAGGSTVALMGAMWDDDEDYEELSDYIKQNYYVIGKYGDGKFIKIPKGRTNAVIEQFFNSGASVMRGEKSVGEASTDLLKVIENNLAPNSLVESSIFAGLIQTFTNTSWYGEDIVPTRLQKEEAKDQYDETTDAFSIWLGQTFGISPYKANYLIDQSTGFLGDMILPLLTEQAETPIDAPIGEAFLGQFYKDYTTDSTMKNQNVTDIFELTDEGSDLYVDSHKSDAQAEDILKYKYLSSATSEMNEYYKEKRIVQNDSSLTNSEKTEALRLIQRDIDNIAKNALDNYENIIKTDNYATIGNKEYYMEKVEDDDGTIKDTWNKVEDDELMDLNNLEMDINNKSTYFNLKTKISDIKKQELDSGVTKKQIATVVKNADLTDEQKAYIYGKSYSSDATLNAVINSKIPFNEYLNFASQEFVADKYSNGATVKNSRRDKVVSYVNSLNLSIPQKAILIRTEYPSVDTWNYQILDYVNGLNILYEDKLSILDKIDMKISNNGYVTW